MHVHAIGLDCIIQAVERSADRTTGHRTQVLLPHPNTRQQPPPFPPTFTPTLDLFPMIDRSRDGPAWRVDRSKSGGRDCVGAPNFARPTVRTSDSLYPIDDRRSDGSSDLVQTKCAKLGFRPPDGPPIFRLVEQHASKCIALWVIHRGMPDDLVRRVEMFIGWHRLGTPPRRWWMTPPVSKSHS